MPRFRQQEVVATRRIALTGHGTVETARGGLEKGAWECLLNPAISMPGSIQKAYESVAEGIGGE